jgi:hypothetical protein
MVLNYKTTFPWGAPTLFREKIWKGVVNTEAGAKTTMRGQSMKDYLKVEEDLHPKIHTIREDVHQRFQPGMDLDHCYYPYTKHRDTFLRYKCLWVQPILIKYLAECTEGDIEAATTGVYAPTVMIGGRPLSQDKVKDLALNDGFSTVEDFFRYFNSDFSGRIIHWTNVRY